MGMLYVHVFRWHKRISNPQVCGRFCAWMAAMHQTVIISESTSRFLSSTWFANLNTVYTAGRDMYVTVCTFEKRELNIWIMCVWVMNTTISRLTSGCPPPPNKNLLGLQRMPSGLVTSKRYPFNDGQKLSAHPNMAESIWTLVKQLYITTWNKQWNN